MADLERSDLLWALQYACDLAKQVGDEAAAKEMASIGDDSDEEMKRTFDLVQYLNAGLQIRRLHLGIPLDRLTPLG